MLGDTETTQPGASVMPPVAVACEDSAFEPPVVHVQAEDSVGQGAAAQLVLQKRQDLPRVRASANKFRGLRTS